MNSVGMLEITSENVSEACQDGDVDEGRSQPCRRWTRLAIVMVCDSVGRLSNSSDNRCSGLEADKEVQLLIAKAFACTALLV